jgi:DNA integrity scanning protein DisA with diadenylate cyclase activity
MVLEKDKVYKIKHKSQEYNHVYGWRTYIICSQMRSIDIDNLESFAYLSKRERYTQFDCHFVVCFDGEIRTIREHKDSQTAFFESCEVMTLEEEDLNDVRKAVTMMGAKYNRKLNKLVI